MVPELGFSLPLHQSSRYPRAVLHAFEKRAALAFVFALGLLTSCQNYKDQLQRGQGYYEQNQYEAALAVFRNLEDDQSALNQPEIARYCYLRGMTDYRLGYRTDARYWLGLSVAADVEGQSALLEDELARLKSTLEELNSEVYGTKEAPDPKEASTAGESATRVPGEISTADCGGAGACAAGTVCTAGSCVPLN